MAEGSHSRNSVINYNPSPRGFMANLSGLASFVSELRVERANLVDRLRHRKSCQVGV
jgi:hypothetical protein